MVPGGVESCDSSIAPPLWESKFLPICARYACKQTTRAGFAYTILAVRTLSTKLVSCAYLRLFYAALTLGKSSWYTLHNLNSSDEVDHER
jgi:hypothetical protein